MKDEHRVWWNKLDKLMRSMPDDLEILVGASGELRAAKRGTAKESLALNGDADDLDLLPLHLINVAGVENNEGSL